VQKTRSGIIRFSADDLPACDRIAYWREVFGRQVFRADIEPLPDAQFIADITLHSLPGLKIWNGISSGARTWRTGELISDGNDDFVLIVNLKGRLFLSQRGKEFALDEREAALGSLGEIGGTIRGPPGQYVGINVPRGAIAPLVSGVDDAIMRRVPHDSAELALLIGYLGIVKENQALAEPQLRRLIVNQIYDLVAVTIGATRDALEVAEGRGIRAARLRAIKNDIVENLGRDDLTVDAVAARHGIGQRYLRTLFESEGLTFSEYVLSQRLVRVHRLLCDPFNARRAIGAIAYECGFGDLSYFYRVFRQHYGGTPSDVRVAAKREQE
jgi:AraC-like DNA-binding protein